MTPVSSITDALIFPPSPEDRPYTFINMVSTIDGKTVSGELGDSVNDLGSKVDHDLMNRTIEAADAVLIGAQTLRATGNVWNPNCPVRVVLSRSGNIDQQSKFLSGGTGLVMSGDSMAEISRKLRHDHGVKRLLILGGSKVNGQFLAEDLVDELFLTIAPKLKLGRGLPTYAEGEPFEKHKLPEFNLKSHFVVGDEVFLRYARR